MTDRKELFRSLTEAVELSVQKEEPQAIDNSKLSEDHKNALKDTCQLLESDVEDPIGSFGDVELWYQFGRLASDLTWMVRATTLYQTGLRHDKTHARTWNNLGYVLINQDLIKEAENAFRKSVKYDASYTIAWQNLGLVLSKQEQSDEARKAWKSAIESDPKYAESWMELGKDSLARGHFSEAEEELQKAIKYDPVHPLPLYLLGRLKIELQQTDEAEMLLRKALIIDPAYRDPWKALRGIVTVSKDELLNLPVTWYLDGVYVYKYLYTKTNSMDEMVEWLSQNYPGDNPNDFCFGYYLLEYKGMRIFFEDSDEALEWVYLVVPPEDQKEISIKVAADLDRNSRWMFVYGNAIYRGREEEG